MCLSPHEMSSERLEELIQDSERFLNNPRVLVDDWRRQVHEGRTENYRELLKERANNGTY